LLHGLGPACKEFGEKLANTRKHLYVFWVGRKSSLLDFKNMSVMETRDVKWLGERYGECHNLKSPKNKENTDLESSDDEIWINKRKDKRKKGKRNCQCHL
jgi:hypothetical protein